MKNAEGEDRRILTSSFEIPCSTFDIHTVRRLRGYFYGDNAGHLNLRALEGSRCPSPKVIAVILMFTNPFRQTFSCMWNLIGFEPFVADSLAFQ
jgi:hypothetical protein